MAGKDKSDGEGEPSQDREGKERSERGGTTHRLESEGGQDSKETKQAVKGDAKLCPWRSMKPSAAPTCDYGFADALWRLRYSKVPLWTSMHRASKREHMSAKMLGRNNIQCIALEVEYLKNVALSSTTMLAARCMTLQTWS
jgi:hypothetical protein